MTPAGKPIQEVVYCLGPKPLGRVGPRYHEAPSNPTLPSTEPLITWDVSTSNGVGTSRAPISRDADNREHNGPKRGPHILGKRDPPNNHPHMEKKHERCTCY